MSAEESKPDISTLIALLSSLPYKIEGQWYYRQQVYLDGYTFIRCRFDQCDLITSKGSFVIDHCFFAQCKFIYLDTAARIVRLYNILATEAQRYWPYLTPTSHEDGTISVG